MNIWALKKKAKYWCQETTNSFHSFKKSEEIQWRDSMNYLGLIENQFFQNIQAEN